ncbi:MAG: ABC transporter substrate-binding protein [Chloroflexota bacterium]|jgi:NitT/TauT family transport system substrate-binding protein
MVTRREVLRRGMGAAAALTAGPFLASCAPAGSSAATATAPVPTATATLAPPETTSIRLAAGACDSAIFGAERYLREEGFTDVKFTDAVTTTAIAAGNADIGNAFPQAVFNSVESGPKVVALGGLHPGCNEIWAQPGIASLKDLKGRTISVTSKALTNLPYSWMAMALKQAGVDPKDVNFVVQADADVLKLYLDGKSDVMYVATTAAAALKANPANKGHVIFSQVMDEPWKSTNCCFIIASEPWYRANPIAAKRAMRAIYRTADTLTADRSDAAKLAADKGLFGGAAALANITVAANMVPLDWRTYDLEKAVRFYAPLLTDVGLLKASTDDLLKAIDLTIFKGLSTELKK